MHSTVVKEDVIETIARCLRDRSFAGRPGGQSGSQLLKPRRPLHGLACVSTCVFLSVCVCSSRCEVLGDVALR